LNTNKKHSFFLTFFILLLILCPSYSILYALTGIYIPNEKLAISIVFLYSFIKRKYFIIDDDSYKLFSISGLLILLIVLYKLIYYDDKIISYVDFHYVIVLFYLPFYISFFKSRDYQIIRGLKYILYIQLLISTFQWICILNGNRELAKLFNNYPYQDEYYFESFFGFVRVSGLFFESSQLAIFFIICASYFKKDNKKLFYIILLFTLSTYSFTGMIGVAMLILIMIFKGEIKKRYLLIILFFSSFFLFNLFERFGSLISILFSSESISDNESFNRLSSMIYKFDYLANNPQYLFFGYANSFDFPSFDFFSVYIFGFGVVGFLVFLFIHFSGFYKSNIIFWPVLICSILGNTVILSSVIIFMYISLFIYTDKKQL
jgi:hypothetical protein